MLTENGSVETPCISVESALTEYRKKLKLASLLMLIVGAVGLVAYIAISTALEIKYDKEFPLLDIMLVFAVPFTLGLIGTITIARLHKRELVEPKTCKCFFFADCFIYSAETVSAFQPAKVEEKFSYADAVLKRENDRYGYIYVFSRGIFLAFGKEDLTVAELNAIRKNFRKAIADGEDTAKLNKFKDGENNNELS